MNKLFKMILKDVKKEKSTYISLIIVIIISIFFGTFFITILNDSDKILLKNEINNFFELISSKEFSLSNNLIPNIINNNIFTIILWILGLSIIGLPFIICILFYKGFTLSFTVTSLIYNFKLEGIFISFIYVFPHLIINLIIYFILSCYSFNLSIKILRNILNKENIKIKHELKKYILILIISIIILCLTALYETYILPNIIKLIY